MQLHNDDCFNVLPRITDKVDMVLVDLPYGEIDCKWDVKLDLDKMWKQLKSICKEDCIYLFFGSLKFGLELIESNKKDFRYEIIWNKKRPSNPFMGKIRPMKIHEYLFVFFKRPGTYNPQKTAGKPYKARPDAIRKGKCFKPTNGATSPSDGSVKKITINANLTGDRYPQSILEFSKNSSSHKNHPTEKPIELLENLIKQYSNEGDLILDFTMGSGSCGVACKNLNRKFIGIEMDKGYYDIAVKRIA